MEVKTMETTEWTCRAAYCPFCGIYNIFDIYPNSGLNDHDTCEHYMKHDENYFVFKKDGASISKVIGVPLVAANSDAAKMIDIWNQYDHKFRREAEEKIEAFRLKEEKRAQKRSNDKMRLLNRKMRYDPEGFHALWEKEGKLDEDYYPGEICQPGNRFEKKKEEV